MNQIIKTFKVYKLLQDYVPTDPATNDVFDILLTKTVTKDDGTTDTITLVHYTYDTIISEIMRNYATFDYTMFYIGSQYNKHNQIEDFVDKWLNYKTNMIDNWTRIAIAYSLDYNPIHNYDRTETGHRDYTNDSGVYTDSTSNYQSLTDASSTYDYTDNDTLTTTNYATTYDDSNNPKISGKTTTKGKYKVSTDGGSAQNKINTLSTSGTNQNENYTNNISGNIGITTSQQMIQSECDLRKLNLLQHIIRGFAEYALTYSPTEEDCDDCYFF